MAIRVLELPLQQYCSNPAAVLQGCSFLAYNFPHGVPMENDLKTAPGTGRHF